MRYVSSLLFFFGLHVLSFAQPAVTPVSIAKGLLTPASLNLPAAPQGGDRVSIWSNDFSNCNDWLIDNAFANGFFTFDSDVSWECGVGLSPSGDAPIPPINSSTADNGFMMVDSDANAGGSTIENCWFQNVTPINCSGISNVSIQFENQYFKWDSGANDGNEKCLLEVSRDGVTWPSITTWEESNGFVDFGDGLVQARWECFPDLQTQELIPNPTLLVLNISSAAQNAETLYLRFRWKGTWGYAWMIDDVAIFETAGNDVAINNYVSLTDYETTGIYEYGVWPYTQLIPLEIAAEVQNNGINTAENVVLNVAVNSEAVETMPLPVNIAPSGVAIARTSGYTPPAVAGTYNVQLTAAMDEDDENPDDNTVNRSFDVSEYLYARDNGVINGSFPSASYTDEFIVANGFQFFEPTTVYAIDVAFTAANAGAEAQVFVLDQNLDIVANSEEVIVNPLLLNGDQNESNVFWTTVPLLEPFDVPANSWFCAAVYSYEGQGIRVGRSIPAPQQSSFAYGLFGTQGFFDWYFINNTTMVRFNLDPASANPTDPVPSISVSADQTVITGILANPDDAELAGPATVTNTGDVPLSLRVSRELIATVNPYNDPYEAGNPGARDRFVWGELAFNYGTSVTPSNQALMVTLQPGESTDSFVALYEHMGVSGTTHIRYCFFDDNDPSIQACIDMYFTAADEISNCDVPLDFGDDEFGISPNPFAGETFATGCLNAFYSDVLHLKMPGDVSSLPFDGIPPFLALDSTQIADITINGVPLASIGLSFMCADGEVDSPCMIPPMGQTCIQISGIASLAGEFTLSIEANFFIFIFGIVTFVSETFEIPLTIENCGIGGCTDPQACNYLSIAEFDDASCVYSPMGNITGDLFVNAFANQTYTFQGSLADEYLWTVTNGSITAGQNTDAISVLWGEEGLGEVCLELLVETCDAVSYCVAVNVVSDNAVLGCTDPSACNFMIEATDDNGSCVFSPVVSVSGASLAVVLEEESYTAAVEGEGVIEWVVDGGVIIDENESTIVVNWLTEGEGVVCVTVTSTDCAPVEVCISVTIESAGTVFGCIDPGACNYNPDATINDGSCDYVTLGVISGPNSPEAGTAEVYSYPNQVGSTFNWTATNGTLTSGQGTATATVLWSEEGSGSVCVTETRDDQCTGEEVCFTVNVLPNNITEHTQETIQVYPNPFDGAVTIAQSGIRQNHLHVYDSMGRRVFERSIQKTEVIDLSSLPSGLYQVAIVSLNGALLHRSALVKQ